MVIGQVGPRVKIELEQNKYDKIIANFAHLLLK
jgi:hypothetical protein